MTAESTEEELTISSFKDYTDIITWEIVNNETSSDELMSNPCTLVNSSFPDDKHDLPRELLPYWHVRKSLYIVDWVVLMKDQVVIPPRKCL